MLADRVSVVLQRIAASLGWAVSLAITWWLANRIPTGFAQRAEELAKDPRDAATMRREAEVRRAARDNGEASYMDQMTTLAAGFGLPPVDFAALRLPNLYALELVDGVDVAPGRSWSSPHLRVSVVVEKLKYHRRGAKVAAKHSVARVENIAEVPVAYRVVLASADRGRCEVRGARMHNANVLEPGEVAEIVVCAGSGAVRINRVEVLEVTPLGHRLLSQVPPQALGVDENGAHAHRPLQAVTPCRHMDAAGLAADLKDGTLRWEDLVDFYSRHDCHRHEFPPGYRRRATALERLPVTATETSP